MARFSVRNDSAEAISAPIQDVWDAMADPTLLAELTPLIADIAEDGDHWRWCLTTVSAMGASIAPCFTVAMTFDEPTRIEFRHDPPAGQTEPAGVNGFYDILQIEGGTLLDIDITMHVELPLPSFSRGAVEAVMARTTQAHGDRFFANLLEHLDAERIPVPSRTELAAARG